MLDQFNPALANSVFKILSTDELLSTMMNQDTDAKQKAVLLLLTVMGFRETCQIKLISFTENYYTMS